VKNINHFDKTTIKASSSTVCSVWLIHDDIWE